MFRNQGHDNQSKCINEPLPWPECTLLAITKAVRERCKYENIVIPFKELKSAMFQNLHQKTKGRKDSEDTEKIPGIHVGYKVEDFHNICLSLSLENEICDVTILVRNIDFTKGKEQADIPYCYDNEYVLLDIRDPPSVPNHCVYVVYKFKEEDKNTNTVQTYFLCQDSPDLKGARENRWPKLPVRPSKTKLYKILMNVDFRYSREKKSIESLNN